MVVGKYTIHPMGIVMFSSWKEGCLDSIYINNTPPPKKNTSGTICFSACCQQKKSKKNRSRSPSSKPSVVLGGGTRSGLLGVGGHYITNPNKARLGTNHPNVTVDVHSLILPKLVLEWSLWCSRQNCFSTVFRKTPIFGPTDKPIIADCSSDSSHPISSSNHFKRAKAISSPETVWRPSSGRSCNFAVQ